jgi:uncharacterized protein YndB with AHSA1/START domain
MKASSQFKPGTVYITYIAATPEIVWRAIVDPNFTRQFFFDLAVEIEPKVGGTFKLLMPDGSTHVSGKVIEWSPPKRLCVSWLVAGMQGFGELPECLVSYDIEAMQSVVRLTMTESHSWTIPDSILQGGRQGWPKILASLKSLIETGKALTIPNSGPPPGFVEAVQKAIAEKPWLMASRTS